MPIIQPDRREDKLPSAVMVIASSEAFEPLELPQKTRPNRGGMVVILWPLLLALGILMLLVRAPLQAPPFESLTQYVCDQLPALPTLGSRTQLYLLNIKCRAGDRVVYQKGLPNYSNNPAWKACRRSGGVIRIWRVANPSPYGPYVFHATCNDHVITYYPARVSVYESTQRFIFGLTSVIVLGSAIGLATTLTKFFRARHTPSSG